MKIDHFITTSSWFFIFEKKKFSLLDFYRAQRIKAGAMGILGRTAEVVGS